MPNFLILSHGGTMPDGPEAGAKFMQAWTDWYADLGDAVVDRGNPISVQRTIAPDGTVANGDGRTVNGYLIIRADDVESAVTLAKGCPVLDGGSDIELAEVYPAM